MTQEILYTSAPEGLKPGSSGFCTVVSTSGMAQNLAMKLESMSGYRHAFPPHSREAKFNPVNYSHLTIQIGGRKYQVLSRISDAGLDYTQRSNKLAHHVALDQTDLPPAGPAALLATPGFSSVQWDGQVQLIPRRPGMESAHVATGPCHAWKNTMGDAGWAGVVASHLLTKPDKTISIIFPRGTDTLALVCEVFSLLPENQRWQTTFSTYFTKLPAGMDCQLRFVLDGTSESTALRRHPHVAVIDLAAPAEVTESHPLITLARTGQIKKPRPPVPRKPVPAIPTHPVAGNHSSAEEVPEFEGTEQDLVTNTENAGIYQYGKPQGRPANGQRIPGAHLPHQKQANYSRRKRRRNLLLKWLMGGSFLLILLLLTFLAGSWFGKGNSPVPADNSAQGSKPATADAEPIPVSEKQPAQAEPETTTSKTTSPQAVTESKPATKKEMEETAGSKTTKPEPEPVAEKPLAKTAPFVDMPFKDRLLPLPKWIPQQVGNASKTPEFHALGRFNLKPEQKLKLEILGGDVLLGSDSPFIIKMRPDDGNTTQSWEVGRISVVDKNGMPETKKNDASPIGVIILNNGILSFKWTNTNPSDTILKYGLLKMSVGDSSVICAMHQPELTNPFVIGTKGSQYSNIITHTVDDTLKLAQENISLQILECIPPSESKIHSQFDRKLIMLLDSEFSVRLPIPSDEVFQAINENDFPSFQITCKYTQNFPEMHIRGKLYAYSYYIQEKYSNLDNYNIVKPSMHINSNDKNFEWSRTKSVQFKQEFAKGDGYKLALINLETKKNQLNASINNKNTQKTALVELNKRYQDIEQQIKQIKDIHKSYPVQRKFFEETFGPKSTGCQIHYRLFLKLGDHEIDLYRTREK